MVCGGTEFTFSLKVMMFALLQKQIENSLERPMTFAQPPFLQPPTVTSVIKSMIYVVLRKSTNAYLPK